MTAMPAHADKEPYAMRYVLVSACLLGAPVRFDGGHKRSGSEILASWIAERRVVAVCPEVAAGLPTPRMPAEISGGAGGSEVLAGRAKVIDARHEDVFKTFVAGAHLALALARRMNIRVAVLKEGSPSCGTGFVYDGSFSGTRVRAQGVSAALLEQHGIRVFGEEAFEQAHAYLSNWPG